MLAGSNERLARPVRGAGGVVRGIQTHEGGPAELGNALEVMRVAATILVVLYHAALAYVATPLRLTLWVAFEPAGLPAFDTFVYWVNAFAMPVFFLAAGVSAPAAYDSRGPQSFLAHRARRLLRPLLAAGMTVLPAFYLLWGYGLMATGRCDLDSILSWKFGPDVRHNLYGLGHLWFLEYLFLVCALWCGRRWLRDRLCGRAAGPGEPGRWPTRALASPWGPVLLALPTAAIFWADPDTMLRVDNVALPDAARLLHYWLFFEAGGWLSGVREPRRRLARLGPYWLALSFVVFALMLPLLLRHAAAPLSGGDLVAFCALAALFPWLTVLGGLGVLLRLDPARGPLMRSLSESAFWVYLAHVPVVALAQLVLLQTSWPVPIKFALVAAAGLAVSFASYGPCVRYSVIGALLNGARKRAPRSARFGPEFGWLTAAAVLLLLSTGAAWSSRVFLFGRNLYAEVPGRLYRSARLAPRDLDGLIGREGLKSVVVFTARADRHSWFREQGRVCATRGVALHPVALSGHGAPTRPALARLVDLLENSPRPLLVEGYRGTDQVAFAAGVVRLLDSSPPAEALRQFGLKYGQFSGAEHSALGRVLLEYRDWLDSRNMVHSSDRFREWARNVYPGHEAPGVVGPATQVARGQRSTTLR